MSWLRAQIERQFGDARLRRVIRNAGITTMSQAISAALNIVRSVVLARYLGVTDFGKLAVIVAATTVVRQIMSVRVWEWATVNLSDALVAKDADRAGGVLKAGYLLGAAVNVVATGVILVLGGWISTRFLHDHSLLPLLRLQALFLLVSWADDCSLAAARVTGEFRWLAVYGTAAASARVAVLAPIVLLDLGLEGVVGATVLIQIVISTWLFLHVRRALAAQFGRPLGGRARPIAAEWRKHARLLATLSATDTIKTLAADSDPLIINYFASPSAVGPYRAAFNIVTGLQQLATPLYMVFYPEMTKAAAAGDDAALRRLVRQTGFLGLAEGVIAALALVVAAPFLIPRLYGHAFAGGVGMLQIMAWALLMLSVQWANPLFVSVGRSSWTLLMVLVYLATKLGFMVALVPRWGGTGAAIAYTAQCLAVIPTALILARRAFRALPTRPRGPASEGTVAVPPADTVNAAGSS